MRGTASYAAQRELLIRQRAEEEAFSAALRAIQDGRAGDAVAAAQLAYDQTYQAAGLAFTAIEQADAAMHGALGTSRDEMKVDWAAMMADMVNETGDGVDGINAELSTIERDIQVNVSVNRVGGGSGGGGGGTQSGRPAGGGWGGGGSFAAQKGWAAHNEQELIAQGWTRVEDDDGMQDGRYGNEYEYTMADGRVQTRYVVPEHAKDDEWGQRDWLFDSEGHEFDPDKRVDDEWWFNKTGKRPPGDNAIETRAGGGPVRAGMPYLVGELGQPELFIPGQSGFIAPGGGSGRNAFGGGIDYDRLADLVAEAMTGVRVEVGAGEISRVAIDNMSRDARRRGYRSGG